MSCTADVEVAEEFTLDGRRVVLIDTPGFDDTNVSDAEILEKIAAFLAVTWVSLLALMFRQLDLPLGTRMGLSLRE